jgi:hypothetical protein
MAKYIGLISSDARGKLGGLVMSRSRSGTTLKAKVSPKRALSVGQVSQQATLAHANLSWLGLTYDNRTTWSVFAQTLTWTNSLGGTYTPTGQQLYIQAFVNASWLGATPPVNFPTDYSQPFTISDVTATHRTSSVLVAIEATIITSPWYWLVFLGRFQNLTVNYTATKARAFMAAVTNTEVVTIGALYLQRFGQVPPLYTNLPVRVVPLSNNAYVSGTPWNAPVLVE